MKLRRKTKMFMAGTKVKSFLCFEILHGGTWRLAGDENGIYRFDTEEERAAKMGELSSINNGNRKASDE